MTGGPSRHHVAHEATLAVAPAQAVAGWEAPAVVPPLAPATVHVWRASVVRCAPAAAAFRDVLDQAECDRHTRFHFARDADRYLVAHVLMRVLLGSYAGRPPADLAFDIAAHGKPSLRGGTRPIAFNMSDTREQVLCATSVGIEVGVDAEAWDREMTEEELFLTAETAFSPAERETLRAADPLDRHRIFFTTWTRKEGYIKATGEGVARGLDHFDVSADAQVACLLADRRDPDATRRWGMRPLDIGPEVSAALVWDRLSGGACPAIALLEVTPVLLEALRASRA